MFYHKLSVLLYTIHAVLNGVNLMCLKSSLQCLFCLLCIINFLPSTSRSTRSNFCVFNTLHIIFLAINLVWGHYCYSPISLETTKYSVFRSQCYYLFLLFKFFYIQVVVKLFKLYHHVKSRELFIIVIFQCDISSKLTLYCSKCFTTTLILFKNSKNKTFHYAMYN